MAKLLNVNLAFTADTSLAKALIQSLKLTLMNLTTATSLPGATKITSDLVSAKNAAGLLKIALQQATNVLTGNLDLTKFNAQLQKGSKDLNYYALLLAKLGPQGVQAFGELTLSILSAEIPLLRTRGLLSEFATTLKNTVRWQFASSALMGITSAVSTAYNYAEKLNSSLNDIRIVSGLSAEEMDKFAKRANKAAQSLSTTTTKYTDAALIFYQQGLSDSEVEERTNATIKMANVTGEAVDDVSSYMTAVWNNFNKDGTLSVEHFGDVMTKLGADTAASTEEIAGGLEKFAGVCDTIGLSFDYATSAITTIVDRTRQSEDVVGTALKTIFSRVQGLKLGDTLDDGTTLNQYSEALAKIGVGIKTLDGELRPMDDILDDIGEKWEDLNNAEKAAVAQKVAGIRQYNQFIALFDNWDFMKLNLATASAADGTLNEQAEIYAESWEGARDRVQAAAEQIYAALIDDDFFISLNNGFADVLGILGDFIENLGGLKTVLPIIASALLVAFGPNIAGLIDELDYRIKRMNGTLAQEALATLKAAAEKNEELSRLSIGTTADLALAKNTAIRLNLLELILSNTKILGEEKANQYIQELDILKILQDLTVELLKLADKADLSVKDRKDQVTSLVYTNAGDLTAEQAGRLDTYFADADYLLEQVDVADTKINQIIQERKDKHTEIEAEKARKLEEAKKTAKDNNDTSFDEEAYTKLLNQEAGTKKAAVSNEMKRKLADVADEYGNNLSESVLSLLRNEEGKSAQELEDFWDANSKTGWVKNSGKQKAKQDLTEKFENEGFEASEKSINNYIEKSNEALEKRKIASLAAGLTEDLIRKTEEDIKKSISDGNTKLMTRGEVITGIASGVMGISAGISSLQGLILTLNDESTSDSEKLLSFITIAPMALSEFIMGWSSLSTAVKGGTAALTAYNAAVAAGTLNEKKGIVVKILAAALQRGQNAIDKVANVLKAHGIVLTKAQTAANTGLIASLGPILIGLLPILAVLTAIGGAIYLTYKQQHKAREEAEKALKNLLTVKENFNEVKSSIQEVTETINNLSDTYDSLNDLTYGTSEWQTKLYEVNGELLDIIDKYGLLEGKDWYRDEQGVIHLTDKGKETVDEKNNKQLRNAEYAVVAAESHANDAENDATREEILYNTEYRSATTTGSSTSTKKADLANKAHYSGNSNVNSQIEDEKNEEAASTKDADNTVRKNNTSAIDRIIEFFSTGTTATKDNAVADDGTYTTVQNLTPEQLTAVENAVAKAKELGNDDIDFSNAKALQDIGIDETVANSIASNKDLQEAIQNLTIATDSNTEAYANKLANVIAGDSRYTEKFKDVDPEYAAGVLSQFSTDVANIVDRTYENVKIDDELRQDYAEANNYVYDTEDNKYYKTDDSGAKTDETVEVSDEDLKRFEALDEAIRDCTKNYEKYLELVEDSKKVWKAADKIKKGYDKNKVSIEELQTALSKYLKALETGNQKLIASARNAYEKTKKANSQYIKVVRENAAELLNISEETAKSVFDDDFIAENASLIEDAINGDVEALDELGEKTWVAEIKSNFEPGTAQEEAAALATEIANYSDENGLEIGATLNDENFNALCTELVKKMGWTADEAEAELKKLGYNAKVTEEPVKQEVSMGYWAVSPSDYKPGGIVTGEPEFKQETKTVITGYTTAVEVESYDGGTSYGGNVIAQGTDSGDTGGTTGGNTGSGSKKTSSAKKVDKKVVRYHNIDDSLEDINKKLEKASLLEDLLFGKAKFALMKKKVAAYKEEAKLLEKRTAEAKRYLAIDKKSLTKTINKFNKLTGGDVDKAKYDADNDILNYNKILRQAKAEADKWYKKAKANPENDAIQDKYDKVKEYYEEIEEALKQVEETREEAADSEQERLEKLQEAYETFYDSLTQEVELKIDINGRDVELLERTFEAMSDLTYKRSEALAEIFTLNTDKKGNKTLDDSSLFQKTIDQYDIYKKEYQDLEDAYTSGEISQELFAEGLEDVYDNALATADSLKELDEQMIEYYSDTLAAGQEELDKYADRIDNVSSSLSHYLTVLDLVGKNKSYSLINTITSALTKTAKSQYDVATKTYSMYLAQQKTAKKAMEDYLAEHKELKTYELQMNDAGYLALVKDYDAITEYVDDAYEDLLSSAEEYLEALNTEYTNFFTLLKDQYLDTLSSTMDFDRLNSSLLNVKTQWDEVLTPVNQAYELTKLVRLAEQDLAKTDSAYAKLQYLEYIDSTKALENKTELSNFELEIQLAKYKQLQAQIALEEALNAKNMVRLSRDSEGNYGYVYTADLDSIADAQLAKDDADNDLYNIRLEGRNNYYEKLLQLDSDYQDAIAEAAETYKDDLTKLEQVLAQLSEEYNALRETYYYNFTLAVTEDDRVREDSYVAAYDTIIKTDEVWKNKMTEILNKVKTKQKEYETSTKSVYDALGLSTTTYAGTVKDLETKLSTMASTVTNKVIPALTKEEEAVKKSTTAYANYRDTIQLAIEKSERLAEVAAGTIKEISGYGTDDGLKNEGDGSLYSNYNLWVKKIAGQKNYTTKADSQGVLHFSSSADSLETYVANANKKGGVSDEILKWNDSVALNLMNKMIAGKHGYFAFDSSGKLHFTTNTKKADAEEYFKNKGITNPKMQSFDTGGYTGNWGATGKLAYLHEKELVLNADDTKNFLAGINILRDVVKSIDLQAMCASNSGMRAAGVSTSNQTLAQEVNITAEFPNATDHSEIEQAFDTLINRAAQYVNRK